MFLGEGVATITVRSVIDPDIFIVITVCGR